MVKKTSVSAKKILEAAVKGMQEVKGHDIVTIDLRKIPNSITDYFVICHGTSDTQVEALARSVEKMVFETVHENPLHKEGKQNAQWILLDYFNVVVHIFKPETRSFYNLEKLWADADVKEIAYQY
jgi:ribosome-associated protein